MSTEMSFDPEKNYDEETLAQQREIEKEIAETQALISPILALGEVEEEYSLEDAVYRHKIEDLQTRYKNIRKVRGDGNCFYRAFGFGYLERLLSDPKEYKRFFDIAKQSKDELIALGFPQFTLEDFYDEFIEVVRQIENPGTLEKIYETFTDQGTSDYFVVYLRLLVSGYLQKHEGDFIHFVDGERTIKDFCSQEVEPMGKESDHIHIVALTKALQVPIAIEYMDRGGKTCNKFIFDPRENQESGEAVTPGLNLLYRPGHYDILYPL